MGKQAFTLIEALISLLVLGIVLTVATSFLGSNQRVVANNLVNSQVGDDLKLAQLRLSELVSQAAYIYPVGVNIVLPGGTTLSTGSSLLAFLVPWESPYCRDTNANNRAFYCAFIYRLEPRSAYSSLLGPRKYVSPSQGAASEWVLVERRYRWLDWSTPGAPATNWASLTQNPATPSVIADSVVAAKTNLANGMSVSRSASPFDRNLVYDTGGGTVGVNNPLALIAKVEPLLVVAGVNGKEAARREVVVPRSLPRVAAPGTGP
jgi:prepilin-type N-terminal cleavage/methylation domain-containing protein